MAGKATSAFMSDPIPQERLQRLSLSALDVGMSSDPPHAPLMVQESVDVVTEFSSCVDDAGDENQVERSYASDADGEHELESPMKAVPNSFPPCLACDGLGCGLCRHSNRRKKQCRHKLKDWRRQVRHSREKASDSAEESKLSRSKSLPSHTMFVESVTVMPKPTLLRRVKSDPCLCGQASPDGSENADESEIVCAICLGEEVGSEILTCGHSFCGTCLGNHVANELRARHRPWCPLCRAELKLEEIEDVIPQGAEELLQRMGTLYSLDDSEHPIPPTASGDIIQSRSFRRMARRHHLKKCPQCNAVIQKNGGCDHMSCRCGHCFNWSQASTVVPCRQVHMRPNGFRPWCTTCPGCSGIAKAKLVGVRTGVVIGAPVVGAVGVTVALAGAALAATGAAVTAAAPAVVCAPMAAAYEPVRRIENRVRGTRKKNIFYKGMGSGVRFIKHNVYALFDSD